MNQNSDHVSNPTITAQFPFGRKRFQIPPLGALAPNDDTHDPLKYYYAPVIGSLYRNRIENGLALLTPPYDSILEVGYGSGILMPTLCSLGRNVWGIDTTSEPQKIQTTLASLGIHPHLVREDVTSWQHEEVKFDLVVAFSVFEHIPTPHNVIRSVAKFLNPGGHLLVGMPRVDRLMSSLFPLIGYHHIDSHHVTRHQELIDSTSPYFSLVKLRTFPRFLPPWAGLYFNMLFKRTDAPIPYS